LIAYNECKSFVLVFGVEFLWIFIYPVFVVVAYMELPFHLLGWISANIHFVLTRFTLEKTNLIVIIIFRIIFAKLVVVLIL